MWLLQNPQQVPIVEQFQFTDIELDTDGDILVPMRYVRGDAAVAQRLRIRLQWFLGEWFLDQRLGVPYHRDVLIKNPDVVLVSAIFRKVVEETPGVQSVDRFEATFDPASRTLRVSFSATLANGSTLTSDQEPFIYTEAD